MGFIYFLHGAVAGTLRTPKTDGATFDSAHTIPETALGFPRSQLTVVSGLENKPRHQSGRARTSHLEHG